MTTNETLLDASAFLELERGLPDRNTSTLDGVEAAVQAANAPVNNNGAEPAMRINKASLDRIAVAARLGAMTTFEINRDDIISSMEAIRVEQVNIFHEHMRFDVFDAKENVDFSDKEFLSKFQKAHLRKETNMSAITSSLEKLSGQLSSLNERIVVSSIPSDPLANEKPVVPKMGFKNAAQRIIEQKKLEKEKKAATFTDMVNDAMVLQNIQHGHFESHTPKTTSAQLPQLATQSNDTHPEI